ncbi:hypothetical protein LMG24238_04076 [Paraburkholderia sediminicola]|uniref:Uncharacterized protein n=1 Tax=Paraburkholderia sediminicola TaxID=458836 RepID=A0A6J5BNU8_9BURK|nr:hypothetical protein LMG24238_04076 [Paraburkholderia sediminicola]
MTLRWSVVLCSEAVAPRVGNCIGAPWRVNRGGRIEMAKKNAAEAALKIWRHPSMKESLLARQSITELTQEIHCKKRN